MKICMIGLGSIGKRHLGNLVSELERRKIQYQIDALRSTRSALPEKWSGIINKQYYHMGELPEDYDIAFITNPTSLHYDTIRKIVNKTKHMFIEKPVFDSLNYNISELGLKQDNIYYVACPLRHKSIMKHVKKIVEEDKVISARIISSSYLPAWRKGVDYRQVYSARKDLGGGVTRDLIHEWDYACYLFGKPDNVMHMSGHLSGLEIDSDDLSIYIARYPDMLLEMHLDYIGQRTERSLQLFTNSKRLDVDLIANTICEYGNNELKHKLNFPEEDFYRNEMEYFLDCIEERKENMNTVEEAYTALKIALTGE
ncbi:MAG: Gfo/Idh/MocA family oxidoreductase [Lachnospiraceae bacterium]|nr:Gfo/Idh/MocA family oxidoreductase [Lachnospiraceae bacterium]